VKLDSLLQEFGNSQIEDIVKLIKSYSRSSGKRIIEALEDEDPELAYEVNMRLFVFEDILTLDDRDVQKIIVEVYYDLAKALKAASPEVREKFFKNMSRPNAEKIKAEIERAANISPEESEKSQWKIIEGIRHMNDVGEIVIPHDGEMEL
jgi:flagellar motor switch protein FliG